MKPGYVYVLKQDGAAKIKIGHTVNIARRKQQLQTGNDSLLRIYAYKRFPDMVKAENTIHHVLSAYRTTYNRRNEWFRFVPDVEHLVDIIFNRKPATPLENIQLTRLGLIT